MLHPFRKGGLERNLRASKEGVERQASGTDAKVLGWDSLEHKGFVLQVVTLATILQMCNFWCF